MGVIEHVASKISAAKIEWQNRDATDSETCAEVQARAAVKGTLEFYRDNVSEGVQLAGGLKCEALMFENDPEFTGVIFKDMGFVFRDMLSKAVNELEA